jgi:hypothetical protein
VQTGCKASPLLSLLPYPRHVGTSPQISIYIAICGIAQVQLILLLRTCLAGLDAHERTKGHSTTLKRIC